MSDVYLVIQKLLLKQTHTLEKNDNEEERDYFDHLVIPASFKVQVTTYILVFPQQVTVPPPLLLPAMRKILKHFRVIFLMFLNSSGVNIFLYTSTLKLNNFLTVQPFFII